MKRSVSDVTGDEVFVDVFGDEVVGFDELPDLQLKRILLGLLLVKRNSDHHTEPLGQLL